MKIYFMGICGTAMGNAALLARAAGHTVIGADSGVYPPMSHVLRDAGIEVLEGYDPGRLQALAPELVVIGNAMSRGNVEVEWLLETRSFPFTSLPALLSDKILSGRRNVVISGTHGKTTTTALTSFLLRENGRDPGFLIGGVPLDPPMGHHLGDVRDPFVIEGDEYDSAFFDKRSKFIHYQPFVAVMNNLEFDHADIFHDLRDIQRTFSHLARIVPRHGWIVVNGDDENLRVLGQFPWTKRLTVGSSAGCDVRLAAFQEGPGGASFELWHDQTLWGTVEWSLPGQYNARNAAMAATAAALALGEGGSLETNLVSLAPLGRFRAVRRRQEELLHSAPLVVVEDFGHHPTAIAETLKSLRARHPNRLIRAAFEPRSNTARTKTLQQGFRDALAHADAVYLGAVNRSDKLKADERFDADEVAADLTQRGIQTKAHDTNDALLQSLVDDAGRSPKPQLVVFFTNGSFDGIIPRLVAAFR